MNDPATPGASSLAARPADGESPRGGPADQPAFAAARFEGLRVYSITVLVLSLLSWFTLFLLVSVSSMIWAIVLAARARSADAPSDVRTMTRVALGVSAVMVVLQLLGVAYVVWYLIQAAQNVA